MLPKLNTFLELSLEIAYRGNLYTTRNLQIQYIIIHLGTRNTLPTLASSLIHYTCLQTTSDSFAKSNFPKQHSRECTDAVSQACSQGKALTLQGRMKSFILSVCISSKSTLWCWRLLEVAKETKETKTNIKRSHPLGALKMGTVFQATFSKDLNCPKHYGYKDGQHRIPGFRDAPFQQGDTPAIPVQAGGLERRVIEVRLTTYEAVLHVRKRVSLPKVTKVK